MYCNDICPHSCSCILETSKSIPSPFTFVYFIMYKCMYMVDMACLNVLRVSSIHVHVHVASFYSFPNILFLQPFYKFVFYYLIVFNLLHFLYMYFIHMWVEEH